MRASVVVVYQLPHGMWDLPGTGIELVSSAVEIES